MQRLNDEILALYREARAGSDKDFKQSAMARARRLLPLSATTWANGVLSEGGPVILEASSIDLKPGFWEAMEPFMVSGEDPLGPMMYAAPGRSFVTEPDFFPPRMQELAHKAFNVHSAITGLSLDPHTGVFSAVCWHRNNRMPPFNEAERLLHEQLLPHWMEGLAMHRVLSAAKAVELAWVPGQMIALVDRGGMIHHAQAGFGELLKEEFPEWSGAALPPAMISAMHGSDAAYEGSRLRAAWRDASGDRMVVDLRHRSGRPTAALARDVQRSVLHASLEAAEHQLGTVSGALAEQQRRQAITEERQRIMRELHDGVGSHLVGLLNLAHSKQLDPQTMEEAVREALDEMRMAVDSMQSSDIDLATAVANLRYRLQPRFDTAGIRALWQIPEESAMPTMTSADIFQWQRILLEAFTNVLKHSRAGHVVVVIATRYNQDKTGIVVEIRDDGVGLDTHGAANHGQGLRNMHHRAQAIGAQLSIETNPPHGVAVRLSWFGSRPTSSHPDPASPRSDGSTDQPR